MILSVYSEKVNSDIIIATDSSDSANCNEWYDTYWVDHGWADGYWNDNSWQNGGRPDNYL